MICVFQFIYWLKTIAAIFITNSHYADIWPIPRMAMGGHLGNCIYFLVSGFCLYQIKDTFPKWYAKRIVRIYPALWIIIALNLLTGFFQIGSFSGFIHCFFYPTWYHFISSIMVLYILFYLWRRLQNKTGLDTSVAMTATLLVCVIVYLFFFDKSYYHIDDVYENWVRFQFWASMLLGARLREKYDEINPRISATHWGILAALLVAYFGGKVMVSRVQSFSTMQFLSPLLLVMLTYTIALIAIKLEKSGFFALKTKLNGIARFVSAITLEIYLGQNLIVSKLFWLPFPMNFVVVTVLILLLAWIAHQGAVRLQKQCSKLLKI